MMTRKYWLLPPWLPVSIRNLILRYEPFDRATFEDNCKVAHVRRYGSVDHLFALTGDWEFTAVDAACTSRNMGVSKQWLAAQWAHVYEEAPK